MVKGIAASRTLLTAATWRWCPRLFAAEKNRARRIKKERGSYAVKGSSQSNVVDGGNLEMARAAFRRRKASREAIQEERKGGATRSRVAASRTLSTAKT